MARAGKYVSSVFIYNEFGRQARRSCEGGHRDSGHDSSMALGIHQEQSTPGGPRASRQSGGPGLGELLRPILSVEVCRRAPASEHGPRGVGATEIQTISASRASVHALAGAHRATGPAALCPVATRREAGGWIVGAVSGASLTYGSGKARGCDSPALLDSCGPLGQNDWIGC